MVKKIIIYLALCSFVLLICCGKEQNEQVAVKNIENNLNLHLSKPESQSCTVYKKIEDNETVKSVMGILLNVQWENAKVEMSRQPDYKFLTVNIDPTVSYEPVTYAIWLSPNKDTLEVIIEGNSKYGKVSKVNTKELLSVLGTP